MKTLLIGVVVIASTAVWTAHGQDANGRTGLTEEQTQQRRSVIEKYDADGNGVLSKGEQKNLSKEDKKVLAKTGGVGTARKAAKAKEPKPNSDKSQHQEQTREPQHDHKEHASHDSQRAENGGKGGSSGNGKGGKK